ncbi:MAG: hypothetical protein ACFFE8_07415 [Candidatus Heimdallarchaeota archaeon]
MEPLVREFFCVPPVEIPKSKKITVLAKRGYFEILKNRIVYRISGKTLEYITLEPETGIGRMQSSEIFGDLDPMLLLHVLTKEITELCFFPKRSDNNQFLMDFIFGDLLPFPHSSYPNFYLLKRFVPNIYEEFYRLAADLEDPISTTMATFENNVFLPFKQKVISAQTSKEDRAAVAIDITTREFPRFIGRHGDLQKILSIRSDQISEFQQISMALISPFLRKIRMISALKEHLESEPLKKKEGISIKLKPLVLDPSNLAELLSPLVKP